MIKIVKEYGLVAILILIGVGGYLVLGNQPEDILASSLDALGQRLVEMVDDQDAKDKTADSFAEFKAKVASNEIAPEDVERIAANVLNLTTSGAKISLEEADLVLTLSTEAGLNALPTPDLSNIEGSEQTPVPMTPVDPEPEVEAYAWSSASSEEMGERISSMVHLADKVKEMSEENTDDLSMGVQYVVDGGLKVIVDSISQVVFTQPDLKDMAAEFERNQTIVWEKNLRNNRRKHAEMLKVQREQLYDVRSATRRLPPDKQRQLVTMERVNRLQEAGVVLEVDSSLYNMRMDLFLKQTIQALESEIEALKMEKAETENAKEETQS